MAKPNYKFDRRQRELKKAQKQEAKRQKKLERSTTAEPADGSEPAESPPATGERPPA